MSVDYSSKDKHIPFTNHSKARFIPACFLFHIHSLSLNSIVRVTELSRSIHFSHLCEEFEEMTGDLFNHLWFCYRIELIAENYGIVELITENYGIVELITGNYGIVELITENYGIVELITENYCIVELITENYGIV